MPYEYFKKAGICLKLSARQHCAIDVEVCIPVCSQERDTIASMGAAQKKKYLLEFHHDCLGNTILTDPTLPLLFQRFQDNVVSQTGICMYF